MFGLVFLFLIAVPVIELYVLFQVAEPLGWITSMFLLVVISMVGGALMRWQTAGAVGRIRATLARGEMPSKELADAALMIFGGALLLTPGFFTDAVGLAMFIPPTRAVARSMLLKKFGGNVSIAGPTRGFAFGTNFGAGPGSKGRAGRTFIDVDEVEADRIPNTELPSDE